MTAMRTCPSVETVWAFLSDQLDEMLEAQVVEHLEACPKCRQLLEQQMDSTNRHWPDVLAGEVPVDVKEKLYQLAPASDAVTLDPPMLEGSGTVIGPYKLLQQIGEGGMGAVFMAEQTRPVKRKVALKIIKSGMDTRQVVARFEAERQALAMMDHPNIAKVLDAGATDQGRPYFVMELVRGIPIARFCNQQKLDIRARLELFATVCRAVQHAHQKGIIHRDLKPSNILVELHDVAAVPKVIDFGVAKATNQQLTDRTLFTAFEQLIGTPLYMSPEQAQLSGLDIDTRSDVYSLGVLLYELLTGTPPFDGETFRTASYDEMRRIIREEEPPRPSQRISTLNAKSSSTAAAQRSVDHRRLGKSLRGELDWIVMKCLEKDRARRYETASGLAADIERYLNDEPIEACPPSAAYRFRKLARRNKVFLTTATLVMGALMFGAAISVWQASEAIAARELADERLMQERRARKDVEHERQRANENFVKAEANASLASANYERARDAVDQMLTRVALEKVGAVPEMEEVRRQLLEDAVQFYTELLDLNPRDSQVYLHRANVKVRLARVEDAHADLEKALELDPLNAEIHARLRHTWTFRDKPDHLVKGLAHARRAAELAPDSFWHHAHLAEHLAAIGTEFGNAEQVNEAKAVLSMALERIPEEAEAYSWIANVYTKLGEWQLCRIYAEKAIALDRWHARGHLERGRALVQMGEPVEARRAFDEAIRVNRQPNDPQSYIYYTVRAKLLLDLGDHEPALADLNKTLALNPNQPYYYKRRAKENFYFRNYNEALEDLRKSLDAIPDPSALTWISPADAASCPDKAFRDGLLALADEAVVKFAGTDHANSFIYRRESIRARYKENGVLDR